MVKICFSYDCVFWCGDLNFRLEQTRAEIIRFVTISFILIFIKALLIIIAIISMISLIFMVLSNPECYNRDIDEGVSVMETDQLG